jgi:hypothetical protein
MAVKVAAGAASFTAGVPQTLFEVRLPGELRDRYVVRGDGQRFLVNRVSTMTEEPIQVLLNAIPSSR